MFPLKFLGPLVVSSGTPCAYTFVIIVLLTHDRLMYARVVNLVGVPWSPLTPYIFLHFHFGRVVLASYPQFHTSSSSFRASCHLYYKIMRPIPDQLSYGAISFLQNFRYSN